MSEMSETINHPIFARIYLRLSKAEDANGQKDHRRRLLADMSGSVIELAAGNGLNFPHYPASVNEVFAVEPEDILRRHAEEAAEKVSVPVRVTAGVADKIPAESGSFDNGVASLVLCSVPDQSSALAELFRVIRPGGELRFYEHVRADTPAFSRFQRIVDFVWPHVGGGCHLTRDTRSAIEQAGFVIESCEQFKFQPALIAFAARPHILGIARRP